MRWYPLVLLFIVIGIFSCSLNTSTNISDKPAYIKFIGNTEGVTLKINEDDSVVLNPENKKNLIYQYPKGIHIIELHRNNELILKTNIVLENGKTTEVIVP